jgi:hypothetical protein
VSRRVSPRLLVALIIGVLVGSLMTGVTFAATSSSSGVKACANSKGVLALLSKGRCKSGYKATTISKQGPTGKTGKTGPAGPGALSSVLHVTTDFKDGPDLAVGNIGLHSTCVVSGIQPEADLLMNDRSVGGNLYVSGTATTLDAHSQIGQPGISVVHLATGTNVVTQHGDEIDFTVLPTTASNADGYMTLQLLVWDGTQTATVDASLHSRSNLCDLSLEVVPGS